MKELMKRPNKRGREDFENAISDDLEKQNFQNLPALALCGRGGSRVNPISRVTDVLFAKKQLIYYFEI
jgi:2-hydroxy-3-keto-5-methylthiopentenyl-1-phosphate phosphatase